MRNLPGVKKVFIRSGIRYDYLLQDKDDTFLRELVKYHVSGQLKVAPEHCSAAVLDKMGKPHIEAYIEFSKKYFALSGKAGKEQHETAVQHRYGCSTQNLGKEYGRPRQG